MSEQITNFSTTALKIHPRNTEFFDDINGNEYQRFKQSIADDGVITPLIVAPDMTIISGHQRHKACVDLGIKMLPVIIREELIDEDAKVRQLIAANFGRLQKGDGEKFRKAVSVYVELNGNSRGGDRKSNSQSDSLKLSQQEIAKQLGVSIAELNRILQVERSLTPEIKLLLDNKKITKTTALSICSNLTKEEQSELVKELSIGSENVELNTILQEKKNIQLEYDRLKLENEKLSNQKPIITETIKEVAPADYDSLKSKVSQLNNQIISTQSDFKLAQSEREKYLKEKNEMKKELEILKSSSSTEEYSKQLKDSTIFFCAKVNSFIQEVGGYVWLTEHISELPEMERKSYLSAIKAVGSWVGILENNIKLKEEN